MNRKLHYFSTIWLGATLIIALCAGEGYAKQRAYTVNFSQLEGGQGQADTDMMVAADGDEYTFTVNNVPEGVSIEWSVDKEAGIWTDFGDHGKKFQSPILKETPGQGSETYHIKAKAIFPPGGVGGVPYEYTWATVSKEPFLDVYLEGGSKDDAYVTVENNKETIYAFVSTASGGSGVDNIGIDFTNNHTGEGDEGQLNPTSGRTEGPSGELTTELTTSTTPGDYHTVTADVRGPGGSGSATETVNSPKITVVDVEISGPDYVLVYCSGEPPTIELTATAEPTELGSFVWWINAGGDKIDSSYIDEILTVEGINQSSSEDDVEVAVTYPGENGCEATHTLTVQKPDHDSCVPDGDVRFTAQRYWRNFTHTVYGHLGNRTLEGCFVEESLEHRDGWEYEPEEGSGYTNGDGQITDYTWCPLNKESVWRQVISGGGCLIGGYDITFSTTDIEKEKLY